METCEAVGFRIIHFSPAEIGMKSLVGIVPGNFPLSFGNYFSFLNPDNRQADRFIERINGPRVVNMWYENLVHITNEKNLHKIRAVVFGESPDWLALIEDDNIPKEYLTDSLCVTGGSTKYLPQVEAYSGLKLRN